MRLDRSHALAQASRLRTRPRHRPSRSATGQTLDRYARLGAVFAASPQQYRSADVARAEPAIRDIAVWGPDGSQQARFDATAQKPFPRPSFAGAHFAFPGGLAFRDKGQVVAVLFDPRGLEPERATLLPRGDARAKGPLSAAVPGWPLAVTTSVDEKGALESWAQALPLYLFVILGPALAGGWLAALFVGAFRAPCAGLPRHPCAQIHPPHRGQADGAPGQCRARRHGSVALQIGIHRPYEP